MLLIVALAQPIGVVSRTITNFRAVTADPKELTLVLVTNIDLFLLSAGFYIIALGFYELFVDDDIELPDWLEIHDFDAVSYTHLRAHETVLDLVCRLLLEKKKTHIKNCVLTFTHLASNLTYDTKHTATEHHV